MLIKELVLGRTFNMGNYESLRVEMKAEIGANENINECLEELEKQAEAYRNYTMS